MGEGTGNREQGATRDQGSRGRDQGSEVRGSAQRPGIKTPAGMKVRSPWNPAQRNRCQNEQRLNRRSPDATAY